MPLLLSCELEKQDMQEALRILDEQEMNGQAYNLRVGVVTPGCSGGGNSTGLVSICPAITGGFIKKNFKKTGKTMMVSTGDDNQPLCEMIYWIDPALAITGSRCNLVTDPPITLNHQSFYPHFMKNIQTNTQKEPVKRYYFLVGLLMMIMLSLGIPSCTHDPFTPVVTNPVDTTGNPVDTTGNPVDTTGQDTTFVKCDSNLVYFNQEVLPIIVSNCAKSGCHDAITHEEGLNLTTYAKVMSSGIVKANNVNGSKLIKVIKLNGGEEAMPPYPNQKLTAEQIALLSKWISQGAKDTSCVETITTCDTSAVSYSGFIAPLFNTFCAGCHSGGNPSGGLVLNSYNGVKAVAVNGRLVGAISWSAGYQKMPQSGNKLSDCSIAKITAWINDGAPNN
jgi:mono/diheme cytochrome c family protein